MRIGWKNAPRSTKELLGWALAGIVFVTLTLFFPEHHGFWLGLGVTLAGTYFRLDQEFLDDLDEAIAKVEGQEKNAR